VSRGKQTPDLPDFFWGSPRASSIQGDDLLESIRNDIGTPELGHAWYTGWSGKPVDLFGMMEPFIPVIKMDLSTRLDEFKILKNHLRALKAP
jgi:hypothetical protein